MSTRTRDGILRLLQRIAPGLVDSIEHDSQCWISKCAKCGEVSSIWAMGGIRWKASGNPRRLLQCPHCSRKFTGRLEKLPEP